MMGISAFVTVLGSSKVFPRKILSTLALTCAKKAGTSQILVSTNDEDIAAEGKGAGGRMEALRPQSPPDDSTKSVSTMILAEEKLT